MGSRVSRLVAIALLASCTGADRSDEGAPARAGDSAGDEPAESASTPSEEPVADAPVHIATPPAAFEAVGSIVRVQGTARREKLGDSIHANELVVLCTGERLPDEVIDTEVSVEGALELATMPKATTSPTGVVSAGTDGEERYVIADCALR